MAPESINEMFLHNNFKVGALALIKPEFTAEELFSVFICIVGQCRIFSMATRVSRIKPVNPVI